MADVLQGKSILRCARSRLKSVIACALGLSAAGTLSAALAHADGPWSRTDQNANSPLRSLAATCAGCHGSDGRGTPDASIPPIAGLAPERFMESMRAFRDGEGSPTIMRQIAAGYSLEQTRALADYFAGAAKR
jgi:cytochrome c553